MSVAAVLEKAGQAGIRLWVEGDRLRYSAPAGALTPALRAEIVAHKAALLAVLNGAGAAAAHGTAADAIAPLPPAAPAPLSFAQRRLWFVEQMDEVGPAYTIAGAARIHGPLDHDAFGRAVAALIDRHASLRTAVRTVDGEPRQVVEPDPPSPLTVTDLRDAPAPERDGLARARLQAMAGARFDLGRAPLLRLALVRVDDERHWLGITLHHIVGDGWSVSVLLHDLSRLYAACAGGEAAGLPPLPVQYRDIAAWQHAPAREQAMARDLDYWIRRLDGAPPVLDLPTGGPRPPVQSFHGACADAVLPAATAEVLRRLARDERATPYMALLAAFAALLWRYTRQDDLVIGMPVAGRTRPEAEPQIGLFVNTLPIRCDLSGGPSLRTVLGRVRDAVLEALAHQEAPFERIVDAVEPPRDPRWQPVCQVLCALQNVPPARFDLAGATLTQVPLDTGTSKVDLFLAAEDRPDGGLALQAEYCTDLFPAERMARLLGHLGVLAAAGAAEPDRAIARLPLLTAAERQQVAAWNATTRPLPAEPTVHAAFAALAARQPQAVAVIAAGLDDDAETAPTLTCSELDAQSGRLARRLAAVGVRPGDVVALHMRRSLALIVGLLGILKAGAAYLPFDGELDEPRRADMMRDAGARVVVTHAPLAAAAADLPAAIVRADEDAAVPEAAPGTALADGGGDDLAYVMYTSGSTGGPKGVRVTHRNILRLAYGIPFPEARAPRRFLQFAPVSFDAATFEIWNALLNGAAVVVAPPGRPTPDELAAVLRAYRIDVLWLTAGLFRQVAEEVPDALAAVPYLFAGGDVLSPRHVQAVLDRMAAAGRSGARLVNGYGPTETTTFALLHWMAPGDRIDGAVPIGRPIGNTTVHVVDPDGEPVPVGVPGELWIGGTGVADGYLNRPELTAERFLPDPFGGGGRVYRTGDLVRRRGDGTIEFLGRRDRQVKLRGFRIEPEEIEGQLVSHAAVRDAVAGVVDDGAGRRRLLAWVVPQAAGQGAAGQGAAGQGEAGQGAAADLAAAGFGAAGLGAAGLGAALRDHLAASLPPYMVPAAIVPVAAFPLNRNGKIDRARLPLPDAAPAAGAGNGAGNGADDDAPAGPAEATLARIWAEVLGRERVGRSENFFTAGGDSILALQVVGRAARAGLKVTVRDLLQNQTIAALAAVAQAAAAAAAAEVAGRDGGAAGAEAAANDTADDTAAGPMPLTPIQRWFFDRSLVEPSHWNQAVLLESAPWLTPERVRAGLARLAARHDALRQRFRRTDAGWQAETVPPERAGAVPLAVHDLGGLGPDERPAAQARLAGEVQASLDLADGPLLAGAWFAKGDRPAQLLLTAHHLAVDVVSWRILLEELAAFCRSGDAAPPDLPAPAVSYRAWAQRLEREAARRTAALDARRGWPPAARLPADHAAAADAAGGPGADEASAATVTVALDPARTAALLGPALAPYRAEVPDMLVAAAARALADMCGGGPVRLDLERHGRDLLDDVDASRTVGWFTTLVPLLVDAPAGGDPGDTLLAARRSLRAAPDRGAGWMLLRHAAADPAARAAAADVGPADLVLNHLGRLDAGTPAEAPFRPVDGPVGPLHAPGAARVHAFELVTRIEGGVLHADLRYSPARHDRATAERFLHAVHDALAALVDRALAPDAGGVVPEDFPLAAATAGDLAAGDLAAVLAALGPDGAVPAARRIDTILPLTPAQQGMLFESLLAPAGEGVHVEQLVVSIDGPLDGGRLERAWQWVVDRHPALRTAFVWAGVSKPLQVIVSSLPVRIETLAAAADPTSAWAGAWAGAWARAWAAERRRPIPLDRPGGFRLALAEGGPGRRHLVWTFHHILLDGWSMAVVLREVMAAYAALGAGRTPDLPPPRHPADHAAWLQRQDAAAAERFWRAELAGLEAPPLPAAAAAGDGAAAERHGDAVRSLSADLSAALGERARRLGVSLSTLFQAAWAVLLARLHGRDDVAFGTTVAGRPAELPGIEGTAGLFIATLPLRLRVPANAPLDAWLPAVQRHHGEIAAHGHVPAGHIHGWSGLPPGRPLYDTLLVFENYPTGFAQAGADGGDGGGVRVSGIESCGARTRHALTLLVVPGDNVRLHLVHNRQHWDDSAAAALLEALTAVLAAALRPEARVADLAAAVTVPVPAAAAPDMASAAATSAPGSAAAMPAGAPEPAATVPRTPLELALVRLWEELLGRPAGLRDSFFDLGGHSLLAVQLVAAVRAHLGRDLDLATLFRAPTVEGLAAALADEGACTGAGDPLIPLAGDGDGAPLVIVPGASGNPFAYVPLAGRLGAARPVLGVALDALAGGDDGDDADGDMVERQGKRLAEALASHDGPVHLLGHSYGAVVAFETARRRLAAGRAVGLVALLDQPAPGAGEPPGPALERDEARLLAEMAEAAGRYFGRDLSLDAADLAALPPAARRRRFHDRLAAAGLMPPEAGEAAVDAALAAYRRHLAALRRYRPRPLAAPVTVLRATGNTVTAAIAAADPSLGWAALSQPPAETLCLPGDHIGVMVEPHVHALAAALDHLLAGLPAGLPAGHCTTRTTEQVPARPCA